MCLNHVLERNTLSKIVRGWYRFWKFSFKMKWSLPILDNYLLVLNIQYFTGINHPGRIDPGPSDFGPGIRTKWCRSPQFGGNRSSWLPRSLARSCAQLAKLEMWQLHLVTEQGFAWGTKNCRQHSGQRDEPNISITMPEIYRHITFQVLEWLWTNSYIFPRLLDLLSGSLLC